MQNEMRERLVELLQEYTDNNNGGGSNYGRADHLIENGVILPPCKVGDTLYRIDKRIKHCSLNHMYSKGNEYHCAEDYNCLLYDTPACDCGEEYYIYEIKTQNIKTIVCNMRQIGKTVFLTREEAVQALKKGEQNG